MNGISYEADLVSSLRTMSGKTLDGNRVTIIGAGITGLTCAYELQRLGCAVTLLEADPSHVGGRVRTLRETPSVYAEVGAMRIPTSHHLVRHYASELGLRVRSFIQNNRHAYAFMRGLKVRRNPAGLEAVKKRYRLTAAEQQMSADDMWEKSVVAILARMDAEELTDLYRRRFQTNKLKQLDSMSLKAAFEQAGLSQEAIEYVSSVYGVGTYLNSALTEHLREEHQRVWIDGFIEVVGGADLIPQAIFGKIREKVRVEQGVKVFKVSQHKNGLLETYCKDFKGVNHRIASDWVICTVPLGALAQIELSGVLSAPKARAARRITYDHSSKVLVRCTRRFWEIEDGIYGGGSIWDGILGHTWYPSDNADARNETVSSSPAILLASYTWGQEATRICSIPHVQMKEFVASELGKIHTSIKDSDITNIIRWDWSRHSLSGGAFAFFNPGDHTNYFGDLTEPDGRFLLAGEHCSLNHSWMQGAFESAIDTIKILTESAGRQVA